MSEVADLDHCVSSELSLEGRHAALHLFHSPRVASKITAAQAGFIPIMKSGAGSTLGWFGQMEVARPFIPHFSGESVGFSRCLGFADQS